MRPSAGVVWGAASTALSACFYLFDFGTTLSALRTYFVYEYRCPHAPLASPLLRDPICHAIQSGNFLHAKVFWICSVILALAHLTYAFIFWVSLHPSHHPFRLAYFMPLIHLYRLLKLLRHPSRYKSLDYLHKSQKETRSLYGALNASLEAAPQFLLQFYVATSLGEYLKGPSDTYNLQAQRIPTNLILSLVASALSGGYNASTAVFSLLEEHIPLARRACFGTAVGCQTIVSMLAAAMHGAAFLQLSKSGINCFPLYIYAISKIIIAWISIDFILQGHRFECQGKNRYLRVAHSLGLALMARVVGSIYVIVKFGKGPCLLILETLSHIFIEVLALAFVFLWPSYNKERVKMCHSIQSGSIGNKYLTCEKYLGTFFLTLFVFVLTSILYVWVDAKSDKSARVMPRTSIGIACITHYEDSCSNISKPSSICTHSSEDLKERYSLQMSTLSYFKLLCFVFIVLFIEKYKREMLSKLK